MSEQLKDSLDHVLLWPIRERVRRGVVTVRISEYGWPWYYADGRRRCPFTTYLLEKLTKQGYTRWDSYIEGPHGEWIVHDDGVSAVNLDDKNALQVAGRRARAGQPVTSVHLVAGNQVAERYSPGGLVAVCGEAVDTASYSLEPDADPAYCAQCVAAVLDWNRRAAQLTAATPA